MSDVARGHRTLLRLGPLCVFVDDGYSPGERVLFVSVRLLRPSFERECRNFWAVIKGWLR